VSRGMIELSSSTTESSSWAIFEVHV